jgi:hypothetical protein
MFFLQEELTKVYYLIGDSIKAKARCSSVSLIFVDLFCQKIPKGINSLMNGEEFD